MGIGLECFFRAVVKLDKKLLLGGIRGPSEGLAEAEFEPCVIGPAALGQDA